MPNSVDDCCLEVARRGLLLERTEGPAVAFLLLNPHQEGKPVIETFSNALWSELDCARAAVRFVRYYAPALLDDTSTPGHDGEHQQ